MSDKTALGCPFCKVVPEVNSQSVNRFVPTGKRAKHWVALPTCCGRVHVWYTLDDWNTRAEACPTGELDRIRGDLEKVLKLIDYKSYGIARDRVSDVINKMPQPAPAKERDSGEEFIQKWADSFYQMRLRNGTDHTDEMVSELLDHMASAEGEHE